MQNDTQLGTSINFFSPLSGKVSSLGTFSIDITYINSINRLKTISLHIIML